MARARRRALLVVGGVTLGLGSLVVWTPPVHAAPVPQSSGSAAGLVGLHQGSRGAGVSALQQALVAAGINVAGGVDGIYGPGTAAAVKQFQSAKGLQATGAVDQATATALAGGGSGSNPMLGLKIGARGDAVRQLQATLVAHGYKTTGDADGAFGVNTVNALTQFQYAQRIKVTARVDEATLAALGTPAPVPAAQPAPNTGAVGFAAYGERSGRVTTLQKALLNAGITVRGGADGIFGSATAAAVMAFQKAKGLRITGAVDQATAQALGLVPGSAPTPAPAPTITLQAFPVQGKCFYGDSWHVSRGSGRLHEGVDIGAAEGKYVYAAGDGKITKQYFEGKHKLTGNGLRVTMADGTYFLYAHLLDFAPGIGLGSPVKAGQIIGYVGTTGNSSIPHLHFEVHPRGGSAVNPYPLVKAINGCGTTTPPAQP